MHCPRLLPALLASLAAHSAVLIVLAPGNPPVFPGMPGEALRVSLMATLKPAAGSQEMKAHNLLPAGATRGLHDKMPRHGLLPAGTETAAFSRGIPHDETARDSADTTVTVRTLQALVYEAFSAHFRYPPLARQSGWQGVVRLGLRIEPNGEIGHIRILASSGYGILDRAAINSLKAVNRLPHAIELLKGSGFDLVLPVRYQLLDG